MAAIAPLSQIRPACVRSSFGPSTSACDRPSARHPHCYSDIEAAHGEYARQREDEPLRRGDDARVTPTVAILITSPTTRVHIQPVLCGSAMRPMAVTISRIP